MNQNIGNLSKLGELRNFNAGDYIFHEGDVGREMFFVITGEIKLRSSYGDEIFHLNNVIAGQIIGEMALLDNEPRVASAIALTKCTLFVINEHNFEKLFYENPRIAINITRRLSSLLRQKNREVFSLLKQIKELNGN